jgi:hypothetical protein
MRAIFSGVRCRSGLPQQPDSDEFDCSKRIRAKSPALVALIQAGDTEGATAYDAACAFALAGKKEEAFRYLELAIARGYANPEHMKRDSDLEPLRDGPSLATLDHKS